MTTFYKSPTAVLDYGVDWDPWLSALTDTIATSVFTADSGITIVSQSNTSTGGTVWLSGGTLSQSYTITHTISTVGGRTDLRTFIVTIIPF